MAELGHFSRAATALHLSQPALSHRIATLERELTVRLFDRGRQGVRLTDAGRAFLEPARAAVGRGQQAAEAARRAEMGEIGRLRLGFTVIASYTALPQAVQEFRSAFPGVTVDLTEVNSPSVESALEHGEIDLGVLHPPLENPHLSLRPLADEQLVLAVPVRHRLAGRKRIRFADLAGEPLLVAPRSVGPVLFDKLIACFRDDDVEPLIVQEATPMTNLAGLVAAGAGIGFVSRGIAVATRPGVAFRPVARAPLIPMAAAWSTSQPTVTAQHFLEILSGVM